MIVSEKVDFTDFFYEPVTVAFQRCENEKKSCCFHGIFAKKLLRLFLMMVCEGFHEKYRQKTASGIDFTKKSKNPKKPLSILNQSIL